MPVSLGCGLSVHVLEIHRGPVSLLLPGSPPLCPDLHWHWFYNRFYKVILRPCWCWELLHPSCDPVSFMEPRNFMDLSLSLFSNEEIEVERSLATCQLPRQVGPVWPGASFLPLALLCWPAWLGRSPSHGFSNLTLHWESCKDADSDSGHPG